MGITIVILVVYIHSHSPSEGGVVPVHCDWWIMNLRTKRESWECLPSYQSTSRREVKKKFCGKLESIWLHFLSFILLFALKNKDGRECRKWGEQLFEYTLLSHPTVRLKPFSLGIKGMRCRPTHQLRYNQNSTQKINQVFYISNL